MHGDVQISHDRLFLLLLGQGARRQITLNDRHCIGRQHMHARTTPFVAETGSQDLVAADDITDSELDVAGIRYAIELPGSRHVVGNVAGVEAMNDPEPLLE